MPALADILRRFRFPGVPGAPAAAVVPAERAQGLEAELAPVFSMLEPAQLRAAELVEQATADASRRREEAHEYADHIVAQARAEAVQARAEAAAARLVKAEDEMKVLLTDADGEAARIAQVVKQRIPALVDELVRRSLAMGTADAATAPGQVADEPSTGDSSAPGGREIPR